MNRLLTFTILFVILVPYLMIRFVRHPLTCIKNMRDDWRMINGDWYDYTPTHSETKEKKTKRQG